MTHPEFLRGFDEGRFLRQEEFRNRESALGAIRSDFKAFKGILAMYRWLEIGQHDSLREIGHKVVALLSEQRRQIEQLQQAAPDVASITVDVMLTNGRRVAWKNPAPTNDTLESAGDKPQESA